MSVLFYRRPDYLNKSSGPINSTECARYVERAKKCERQIPDGLSFDDVLSHKSLPPCSLNDFMDYLVYVEHNAENLQFFLWFKEYTRRFNALPESEKALSPEWVSEAKDPYNLSKEVDKDKELKMGKRGTITTTIANGYDTKEAALFSEDKDSHAKTLKDCASAMAQSVVSPSLATSSTPTTAEVTSQAGLKWQAFSIQPMREEVNRVMRHYIAFNSPRELNLSHRDRSQCLHALQHTTHPSALFLVLKTTEAALRGQSHPNFIRWSICNGNKPRVFFVRTMGVTHILLGFLIAIVLTLSRASRWWRILSALAWFIGISTMVAAYKGLCVILHKSHARNLRPWEQGFDEEMGHTRRNSDSSTANRNIQLASRTGHYDDTDKEDDRDESGSFRPTSLQTFGPKNSFETADWVEKYETKPMLKKVFEDSVWTQDETLRILQDRIVLGANIWAVILTVLFTVVFVALPKGNLY